MMRSPKQKTYYIETYGCQMNLYDSDLIASILEQAGYRPAREVGQADVVAVNTCSVRDHAERRALGRIRELAGLKRRQSHRRLVICGCMAQRLGQELLSLISGVDAVVGTDQYRQLPEILERTQRARLTQTVSCAEEIYAQVVPRCNGSASAFTAIMRGCDNACAYCIVPRLRGPARSRPLEDILHEVDQLVQQGCREVIFLGQNVNSYRDGPHRFVDLLRKAGEIKELSRIRFVTSHPKDMDDDILETMAQPGKVCEHLHLPLQSGSDNILTAMRRGYTAEHYRSLVLRARQLVPGLSITTDLIAGFPGETEEDFQQTLEMMSTLEFDDAFTFEYSPRPQTEAASLPGQVPFEVRRERLGRLIAMQRGITRRANERLVGQKVEILVEGPSKRDQREVMGKTRSFKTVIAPGDDRLIGQLVPVQIRRIQGGTAWGERVRSPEPAQSSVR